MATLQKRPAAPVPVRGSAPSGLLQRQCACGGSPGAAGECEDCARDRLKLQRSVASTHDTSREVPPIVGQVLGSGGAPLDDSTRTFMEPRFGHNFANVRVHTDARAAESARAVNANAYTVGRNIVFGTGRYAPSTAAGRRVLAHELTHVVQQGSGASLQPSGISSPSDAAEREAECISDQPGTRVQAELSSPWVQRQPYSEEGARQRLAEIDHEVGKPTYLSPEQLRALQEERARLLDLIGVPEGDEAAQGTTPKDVMALQKSDAEFWSVPESITRKVDPIFDDELGVVIGYRSRGSYWEIYDLEGKMVASGEAGLESPLIDPIDILAGGLTGLGRGLFRGGIRSAGRTAAASTATRLGFGSAVRLLSRQALTAVRAAFRALRFRGVLKFTATTAARMADPARRVPYHILQFALKYGRRVADPQMVAGAFRYTIPMVRNGKDYVLEVVIREADNTILHFLYR